MRIRTMILIMSVIFLLMPNSVLAGPGITITLNPLTKTTQNDITTDYEVIIINEDGVIDSSGKCIANCEDKTIDESSWQMSNLPSGWDWSIDTLSTNYIPAGAGNQISTTLHITPHSASDGSYHPRIDGSASGNLFNYLFRWDEVPGQDSDLLKNYISDNYLSAGEQITNIAKNGDIITVTLDTSEEIQLQLISNAVTLSFRQSSFILINIDGYIYEGPIPMSSSDYEEFETIVTGNSAPIPEFPTIGLPIISVLGLVFLLHRRI